MGNHEVVASKIQSLRSEEWVEAGEDQENAMFSNVNPYRRRLLAHVCTKELIEEYELNFITEEDFNSYVNELGYRQNVPILSNYQSQDDWNGNSFIYPIRYFLNKSKHEMCTTIHTGYLYADKVQVRLKEINDIPFQDLLYMYKSTFNGFKILYQKVGYFDIVEQMIFITKTGQVKVWMNANLAKNYPNYQKSSNLSNPNDIQSSYRSPQNIYGSQSEMIRKLILMIEKNSDIFADSSYQPQHQLFSEFLEDKKLFDRLSFQHSLDQFQNYLSQNNLHCSDYMKSIPQLFSPDEFPKNAVTNYEQSHVNEITSQHLTQMKKRFEPMETIIEDDNINNKSRSKNNNAKSDNNFHESQVAKYTNAQSFSTAKQLEPGRIQERKAIKPGYMPFSDLNQSKLSDQQARNITQNQYSHLQNSRNSCNINAYYVQKPNSVSAVSYRPYNQGNLVNQKKINPLYPVSNLNYQPQTNLNGFNSFTYPEYHLHHIQPSQKIMTVSPPPSFRSVGVVPNNLIYHTTATQNNQPIKLPVPNEILISFSQANNRQPNKIQDPSRRQQFVQMQNTFNPSIKAFTTTSPITIQNFNNGNNWSENAKPEKAYNNGLSIKRKESAKGQPSIKKIESLEDKSQQNSKIKYFTKNKSYQLDAEIASDLEKFLGLKVN